MLIALGFNKNKDIKKLSLENITKELKSESEEVKLSAENREEDMLGNAGNKKVEEKVEVKKELNENDPQEVEEVQKIVDSYVKRMKTCIESIGGKIGELIKSRTGIVESDEGHVEIIELHDLMFIIKDVCPNEFTDNEIDDIQEIFMQLGTQEYVFVESLLELFGELPEEGEANEKNQDQLKENQQESNKEIIQPNIRTLDEISQEIIFNLVFYLKVFSFEARAFFEKIVCQHSKKKKDGFEENVESIEWKAFLEKLNSISCLPESEDKGIFENLKIFLSGK